MSDSFLDTALNPDGPNRSDENDHVRRHMGQIRQYRATGKMSDDVDPKYIPTQGEIDEVRRNAEYENRYHKMSRDLQRQKALASAALLRMARGSFEYHFIAQRLLDIDDAAYNLGKLKRAGAPLSIRVFEPLPESAVQQPVDKAPPPKTLWDTNKPPTITEEMDA